MNYSIIIPVFNEERYIPQLLIQLRIFSKKNEIIIIDDGSTDRSQLILKNCNFINLHCFKENKGKGVALKKGIQISKYSKLIIFDGDLELETQDVNKLMILDKSNNVNCALGYRYKKISPINSGHDWGNFMFTTFFNLLFRSSHKDILCCGKSFYKKDIILKYLKADRFDIDVELISYLTKNNRGKKIEQVYLNYKRRYLKDGKKLKTLDGWKVLKRIILNFIS
ncbi:glycosyltransferase family 2 protein [Candidatus Marinimicrobia bacterium]|nr:glycosyltransferase family 2 protein [Candidatus Neomarinimicrobiota bacterium]